MTEWWAGVATILEPLLRHGEQAMLADLIDALAGAGEALCGEGLWSRADGRALAQFVEELREAARETQTRLYPSNCIRCCATRWSGSRCGRLGAGTPALPSMVCWRRG